MIRGKCVVSNCEPYRDPLMPYGQRPVQTATWVAVIRTTHPKFFRAWNPSRIQDHSHAKNFHRHSHIVAVALHSTTDGRRTGRLDIIFAVLVLGCQAMNLCARRQAFFFHLGRWSWSFLKRWRKVEVSSDTVEDQGKWRCRRFGLCWRLCGVLPWRQPL